MPDFPILLVLFFCTKAAPSICTHIIPNMGDTFPFASVEECVETGNRIAAEFTDIHPHWSLSSVGCIPGALAEPSRDI